MASSSIRLLAACAVVGLLPFLAAADDSGSRWIDVEFSRDSPVLPVSFSLGPGSTAGVRGTSMAFELHASLLLRNTGTKPLSGLTLRVEAK
ncbi:MAG: hypothetical protein JO217_14615, partial [Acidobacteriaceae bacterium]|nr:hypothetical protein [Acidobacteriaceae bacterium]